MNMHEVLRIPREEYYAGCLLGSKDSWKRPTHSSSSPPEYTAKNRFHVSQTRVRNMSQMSGLLWLGTRRMVFLLQLRAHFAVPVPIPLSASPNRLKNENLEDVLRLCGEIYPQSYKKTERDDNDFLSSRPAGSKWSGLCVMAALSSPRRFAAWRVEAPHFAVLPPGGPSKFSMPDPYANKYLVLRKALVSSAVARTTPYRAFSILPYCLAYPF